MAGEDKAGFGADAVSDTNTEAAPVTDPVVEPTTEGLEPTEDTVVVADDFDRSPLGLLEAAYEAHNTLDIPLLLEVLRGLSGVKE